MHSLLSWLARRLGALPDAEVIAQPIDADLSVRFGQGPRVDLEVIPGRQLSSQTVERLVARLSEPQANERPRVLVVERLRPAVRHKLAQAGVSWAEEKTGLLHLVAPPYYIHDTGPAEPADEPEYSVPRRAKPKRPTRLVGLSGRCAESILLWCEAHRGQSPPPLTPTLLSALAEVTVAMASHVLHRLEREGALEPRRTDGSVRTLDWSVVQPQRVLDLWVAEDTRPPRTTPAYVWARSSRDLLSKLTAFRSVAEAWALGGVAAANLYAPTLTADPIPAVWIPDSLAPESALRALGGEVVDEGSNLLILQTPNDPWSLHRLDLDDVARVPGRPIAADDDSVKKELALEWRQILRRGFVTPPSLVGIPQVALVSRPRAVVEALHEGRGRADDVAEVVRTQLALDNADN